jgi:hypothetical protein
VNEDLWLTSRHPYHMLEYLRRSRRYRPTRRKLHLFACRCVRRIRGLLAFAESEKAIVVAERFADDKTTPDQLHSARVAAQRAVKSVELEDGPGARSAARAAMALTHDPPNVGRRAIPLAINRTERVISQVISSLPDLHSVAVEHHAQADLLRCIFGNPFASLLIEPGWRTSAVIDLATAIYDQRAFKTMPILADALEEAGCTDVDLLQHCRGPGPHGRGCWVVDAILGKK